MTGLVEDGFVGFGFFVGIGLSVVSFAVKITSSSVVVEAVVEYVVEYVVDVVVSFIGF